MTRSMWLCVRRVCFSCLKDFLKVFILPLAKGEMWSFCIHPVCQVSLLYLQSHWDLAACPPWLPTSPSHAPGFPPSQIYTFLPSHSFFHLSTPSSRLTPPLHSQGMSICNSLVQAEWARRRYFDLSPRLLPAPIVQLQCCRRQTLSSLWGGADEMGPSMLSRNSGGVCVVVGWGEASSRRKRAGIYK